MFCKSPNSISLFTSFFIVRGLQGTFSFAFNPNQKEVKLPLFSSNQQQEEQSLLTGFLSSVGEQTLEKLYSGNFNVNHHRRQNNKKNDGQEDQNAKIQAAVGRQLEYLHCLLMNLHCPVVKNVFLLVEDSVSAELLTEILSNKNNKRNLFAEEKHKSKIVPILFSPSARKFPPQEQFANVSQPLYSDFFYLARQMLHPTNDVAAICNSDIHFHTKGMIEKADIQKWFHHGQEGKGKIKGNKEKETVLALTRYEEDEERVVAVRVNHDQNTLLLLQPRIVTSAPLIDDYRGSHDAFLFRPKVISDEFISRVRHPQNAYQSENIVVDSFMKEAEEKKVVDLRNPCLTGGFEIAHKHHSDVRQWYPPLNDGRYGKVEPE